MDREDKEVEYAPKGMFPEDDDEDSFEIDVDEDLDVWNRGSSYTWGKTTSWWQGSYGGSTMSGMWSYGGSGYVDRTNNASRMVKHKGHIDSLCKVVDPTVPHTLEFASRHGSGHTDMRRGHIVVDGSLIERNDDKLDTLSGLAIHEKLHVIHSKPLMTWQRNEGYKMAKTEGQRELLHSIGNIIEDEYIERQLHKTCAGFVHYIEACKQHYFDESAEDIKDADIKDKFGDLVNTFLMLVRYPSEIDLDRRKRHAPHIRVLMSMIKGGIDSREATLTCIAQVYSYMMAQAKKMDTGEEELIEGLKKKAKDWAEKRIRESFEDIPDDKKPSEDLFGEMIKASAEDRLKRLKRMYSHDDVVDRVWKETARKLIKDMSDWKAKKIENSLKEEIKKLEDSDYWEEKIEKSLSVANGQRKITWRKAIPESHHIERYKEDKSIMKGQISKLKKKVQLYGNLQKHTIYNQKRGILDKRNLHRIPMGMTDIFKAVIIQEDKPLDICILVDESGSMGSYCMSHARQSAIAIKEALMDNPMINLWVYGHSADQKERGATEMIEYWSPSMKDRPMAMGSMKARYENRDGNAIVASAQRVNGESDNVANKLMLVLSDGAPSADAYRGARAYDHTKKCVKHIEQKGWSVIQVGFSGATTWTMEKMFKNFIYVDEITKIGDMLSKIIRKVIKV